MKRALRAFTVLEMLVVIGIITILLGIGVPVLMHVKKKAMRNVAQAQLKVLGVAIEQYYARLGRYPVDTGYFQFADTAISGGDDPRDNDGCDPYSLYRSLCRPVMYYGQECGPFLDEEDFPTKGIGEEKILLDPWGRPWVYEENMSQRRQQTPDPKFVNSNSATQDLTRFNAHNADTFDLFGVGPDGAMEKNRHNLLDDDEDDKLDEPDETEGDGYDVTNWE